MAAERIIPYVFVSYARGDYAIVRRIVADLEERGVNVWIGDRDIPAGSKIDNAIENAIRNSALFVTCISPYSLNSHSVRDELITAERLFSSSINTDLSVIPVIIKHIRTKTKYSFKRRPIDLTVNYNQGFAKLIDIIDRAIPSRVIQPATLSLNDFQSCLTVTPLTIGGTLISLSVNIANSMNRLRHFDEAFAAEGNNDYIFVLTDDFNDLIRFLLGDGDTSYLDKCHEEIFQAISNRSAVLYYGSIKSATPSQLTKIPEALKAFSSLSSKQFRIGLFRMSTTLVIITFIAGGSARAGWSVIDNLTALTNSLMNKLIEFKVDEIDPHPSPKHER